MKVLVLITLSLLIVHSNAQCRCQDYQYKELCPEETCTWSSGACKAKECEDMESESLCTTIILTAGGFNLSMNYIGMMRNLVQMKRCYWNSTDKKCYSISHCSQIKLDEYTEETCGMNKCRYNAEQDRCYDRNCADFGSEDKCDQGFFITRDGSFHQCEEVGLKCLEKQRETSCGAIEVEILCERSLYSCFWDDDEKCKEWKCKDQSNNLSCKKTRQVNGSCIWADSKCNYLKTFPITEMECGSISLEEICIGDRDSPCYWESGTCKPVENCQDAYCKDNTNPVIQSRLANDINGFDFIFCKGDGSKCKDYTPNKEECLSFVNDGFSFVTWDGKQCRTCIYLEGYLKIISIFMIVLMMMN